MRYPDYSDEELAHLPERGKVPDGGIHHAMHFYHLGLNLEGLSQMMISRLSRGGWACPVCGEFFPPGVDPRAPGRLRP